MMDEARMEKIDRYLNNQMTVIERTEFEERLALDPDLVKDMQMVKQANELLQISGLQHDADVIKSWQPPKRNWYRYLFPGIGLVLVVALLITLLYFFKADPNESKISNYTDEIESIPETREVEPEPVFKDSINESKSVGLDPLVPVDVNKPQDSIVSQKEDKKNPGNDSLAAKISTLKSDNTQVETSSIVQKEKIVPPKVSYSDSSGYSIAVFNCSAIKLTSEINVENTCIGKNEGKVHLNKVSGGSSPYSFSLDSLSFSQTSSFEGLSLGQYVLYIKDSNGCTFRKPFDILEKDCRKNDFAFSPETGQKFVFPLFEGESGFIKIMSETGEIMHQAAIQYGSTWDGISIKGKVAPVNSYPYIIRLNNGRVIDGTVTVTSY